jgi:hypothetical protein
VNEFEELEELSSAIQAAATTVCFLHPGYCTSELMVADISLWCLDNNVLEDIISMGTFVERVWWLMAVGIRLVKAGLHEYDTHQEGTHSVS